MSTTRFHPPSRRWAPRKEPQGFRWPSEASERQAVGDSRGQEGGVEVHTCSKCQIDHRVPRGGTPVCPLCESEKVVESLRAQQGNLASEVEQLRVELRQTRAQLEPLEAMRSAVELLSDEDLVFVKSVLYRYRADPSTMALQPLHTQGRVVGLVALPRPGEPEPHQVTSVGGKVLALCYADVTTQRGSLRAMEVLLRALSSQLSS